MCWVRIWTEIATGKTDFGNQKTSHCIVGSRLWSMIEWWISNACYPNEGSGRWIYCQVWCVVVSDVCRVCRRFWRLNVQWAGKANIYVGLEGLFWSGDIVLAKIQQGNYLLGIIQALWFVDWTLKFIIKTTTSMLCSHISLMYHCSNSCTLRWSHWVSI